MASRRDFLSLLKTNSFDKPFINYFSTEQTGFSITYREYLTLTDEVNNLLSKSLSENFEFIGIQLNDYLWLPCLLISIWKLGKACACIGAQYSQDCNLNFLNALQVKYLITDNVKHCFAGDLVDNFQINSRSFYVWMMKTDFAAICVGNKPLDICYGIMTSGSTGSPKIIQVPWSCILPNVYELVHLFSVNDSDNVYLSSPYTFDPFFVELFMSVIACCTLTIVSPQLKISSEALLKILFEKHEYNESNWKDVDRGLLCKTSTILQSSVSIIQMTPSIFKRWSSSMIKDSILSKDSPLRILLLGGEKFPTDLLKLKSESNKTQIYNIYGITEVSCWAFINCVTENHDDISLGCPLNDIVYKVDENNEFLIGSNKRRCLVGDEQNVETDRVVFRKTGDLVMIKNSEIYYSSRTNQIVKKFGIKVNLEKIENVFLKIHKHIKECFCVFDENTMKLALYYTNDKLNEDYNVIYGQEMMTGLDLTSIEVPDFIIEIPKTPLNSNGKCDKKGLMELLREIIGKEVGDVESVFERIWTGIVGKRNFVLGGGDSVKALQMITRLEEAGVEVTRDFLPTLLADGDYGNCLSCLSQSCRLGNKKIKLQMAERSYRFTVSWTFDTTKCVDASPTIFERNGEAHAAVGSHSSSLSSVKIDTGQENWTINLTDRIESGFSVNKSSTFGVIGCYDQHVYCLSTSDGEMLWKYGTGGMIKSTPCLSSDEETVYVASYDTFLYCLKCRDGTLIARVKLSDRGVFSSGIVSDELGTFFIGTLDGSCISLSQESNEIIWKHRLGSPIFASPVLANSNATGMTVIFAEVVGQLNCFDARTGNKVWRYECGGYVYATPVFSSALDYLVFPCYDNELYCLKLSAEPSVMWKAQLDSPGFAKPCLFSIADTPVISVASTKGWVYLFSLESGSNLGQVKLNGEIFSSPKVSADNLIVGCRDNNLYCVKIEVSSSSGSR